MSRFGVMKHLKQLEEAGLVVTRRRGREQLHVPSAWLHLRWVSKYSEPWVAGSATSSENWRDPWRRSTRSTSGTDAERLWEAITDPEIRRNIIRAAPIRTGRRVRI